MGLVAVGDSIVNGHGDSMAGVPALSWAQWLADAMDLSFTRYALGGATSKQIADELLPRVRRRYKVGVFNMGTNDAYHGLDAGVLRENLERAAEVMTGACERVVVLTVPISAEATRIVREVAAAYGVVVVDAEVRGPRLLSGDGIHPTALGHLEIADRAAVALGSPMPSALARNGGRGRLGPGYWTRYAAKWAKARARYAARAVLATS